MNVSQIAINEIFTSIQGEGALTGNLTMFVRTQGCKVGCIWCDTKDSWAHGEKATKLKRFNDKQIWWKSSDLCHYIAENSAHSTWVCFTGGEPFEQLKPIIWIVEKLANFGYKKITVETAGHIFPDQKELIDLYSDNVFFSVSPKLPSALGKRFDKNELMFTCKFWDSNVTTPYRLQFKFVVSCLDDIDVMRETFKSFSTPHHLFLQMEESVVEDRKLINKALKFIDEFPRFRMTIQQHKILKIR